LKTPVSNPVSVFPTCVGVFLTLFTHSACHSRLPHVRGGVSLTSTPKTIADLSSPRAWGCFRASGIPCQIVQVFPTCVGVFHVMRKIKLLRHGLPHVRGGVSAAIWGARAIIASSPRAWGCFQPAAEGMPRYIVFPTCVGVFPLILWGQCLVVCLPHVRGGVSGVCRCDK
jgi:hypothetical protein